MANIQVQGLFDQKQREFRTQGQGSTNFQSDFIEAVNLSIQQINVDANLATAVDEITNVEGTIGLDNRYRHVLTQGVSYYLIKLGQRKNNAQDTDEQRLWSAFTQGITAVFFDTINTAQANDTDDEVDIIGLGAMNPT